MHELLFCRLLCPGPVCVLVYKDTRRFRRNQKTICLILFDFRSKWMDFDFGMGRKCCLRAIVFYKYPTFIYIVDSQTHWTNNKTGEEEKKHSNDSVVNAFVLSTMQTIKHRLLNLLYLFITSVKKKKPPSKQQYLFI